MKMSRNFNWIVMIAAVVYAASCSGGGCGGCTTFEPIPGGFPAAKRSPNATQVRVTQSAIAALVADPEKTVGGLLGGGGLAFPIPGSCGGDPEICCANGQPVANCGPLNIDLQKQAGDDDRLVLTPVQGANRLNVTMRARLKTSTDIPIKAFGVSCGVRIETDPAGTSNDGAAKDIELIMPLTFQQDATAGTTKIVVGDLTINRLEDDDITLNGGFLCVLGSFGIGFFVDTLKDTFADQIKGTIQDQMCKKCETGDVSECGSFATACTDNVCMKGSECLQELGIAGRMRGTSLFGALSPGTTGALDVYEVLGGYATSNQNGLALGMLGGMQPGGVARDRCGPAAADPGNSSIPQSAFFQGNVRPDNNQPFDVGIGVHKSQLEQFAYAGYDGGLLCLTITGGTIAQLNTDTFGLLSRSLGKLVEGNSPMAVGLRPQSPPTIVLGRNIFTDDGMGNTTLTEPLLDLNFTAMEIDFFASVDDQYIRTFTVVADVHFPIGLQTTAMGELQPVIGDVDNAFTNLMVKNSEALTESPDELAGLFPSILNLALPQLSNGLSPIALPAIGNLQLAITDVTSVDNNSFLAIFANLVPTVMPRPVDTRVALGEVYEPPAQVAKDPKQWKPAQAPKIGLSLGGEDGLEWSYRLDAGTWSAWSTNRTPTIRSSVLWLPGTHKVEVRARQIGKPETIDTTPVSLDVELGAGLVPRRAPFHGQPGEGGCNCDSSSNGAAALPFALLVLLLMLPLRRVKRRVKRLGTAVWFVAIACLPGCSCGSAPCGDVECLPGDVEHGGLGRWTSIAGDDTRVVVATHDQGLGDLVAADVTDPANVKLTAVDGIPDEAPTHDPSTYRKGVEGAGPNVGAFTSIAMSDGLARISYQDRDGKALKFAFERKQNDWTSHVVDAPADPEGQDVGRYSSLAIDAAGLPAIAYIALGNDDGTGHRLTELRIARASSATPSEGDWSTHFVASGVGTCAGLCPVGEACIAGVEGPTCASVTSDCSATCADTEACIGGACTEAIADPTVADIATGTGLFARLVVLPDARLAVVHYDRAGRGLKISVENGAGANTFTEADLDVGSGDRGLWASAVVDGAGTIHVAYQDAIGDQLLYTTWNGAPGTPELVDDGQRAGDRTHPVGAASAIFLANGAPQIAYQDGLTADVYVAAKSGTTWSTTGLAVGALLDGFSIAVTTAFQGIPYMAWDRLDPALSPPNGLFVQTR
jgi:MYXO-CTERM domain-containing protein